MGTPEILFIILIIIVIITTVTCKRSGALCQNPVHVAGYSYTRTYAMYVALQEVTWCGAWL